MPDISDSNSTVYYTAQNYADPQTEFDADVLLWEADWTYGYVTVNGFTLRGGLTQRSDDDLKACIQAVWDQPVGSTFMIGGDEGCLIVTRISGGVMMNSTTYGAP